MKGFPKDSEMALNPWDAAKKENHMDKNRLMNLSYGDSLIFRVAYQTDSIHYLS